jgi:hypothetical protein
MTKRILSLFIFVLLLRADFDVHHWQYRRTIAVTEPRRVSVLTLDPGIYACAQADLADLRLVRDGQEIPYVLERLSGRVEDTELPTRILDRSVDPRSGLQLTLDAGRPVTHNRIRISTALTNFRVTVRIETSTDGRAWALAREDGHIFDFTQDGLQVSVLSVDYSLSTRRYVRATFPGWTGINAAGSVWLAHREESPAVWQVVGVQTPARTEQDGNSLLVVDLGSDRLPVSRVTLDTFGPQFRRACEVESSEDRKHWEHVAQGVIYRFADEASSSIRFPEQHRRYLRVRILNGDDKPVAVGKITLETIERRLKFRPDTAGDYSLYAGNPAARPPVYDLAAILGREAGTPELVLTASAEQGNPSYHPPPAPVKPWSERHPALLYGTLAAAILGMGWVIVRFLASIRRSSPSSEPR